MLIDKCHSLEIIRIICKNSKFGKNFIILLMIIAVLSVTSVCSTFLDIAAYNHFRVVSHIFLMIVWGILNQFWLLPLHSSLNSLFINKVSGARERRENCQSNLEGRRGIVHKCLNWKIFYVSFTLFGVLVANVLSIICRTLFYFLVRVSLVLLLASYQTN